MRILLLLAALAATSAADAQVVYNMRTGMYQRGYYAAPAYSYAPRRAPSYYVPRQRVYTENDAWWDRHERRQDQWWMEHRLQSLENEIRWNQPW